ncbi:alpha/beta fold hydrolase [Pseudosulfitobacter koreensis]|uniref:Alpha/beta hydrolase n=1 Tax=Pseudosulfitobacter koreensis TaxID=2968472 RepID=A0ABT1Z1E7_9RHOB|nr:alpha/beta hydrolase [Pseudosulfitobacter koreense]MCR8826942.1 alpha/beta hydrolase [Pseudosulfitobacter koreense]
MAACGTRPEPSRAPVTPLLFNAADIERQDKLLILVPGSMTPLGIFDPVVEWHTKGYAFAAYRFPGMDGRPLDGPLDIARAAQTIVTLAERYPDKEIKLLGFSTGAPIAMLAAKQIGPRAQVAAMSSAVEFGGGAQTGLRGIDDILVAAARARSVNSRKVWEDYFPVLLFGREGARSPERADDIARIAGREKKIVVEPSFNTFKAHTMALVGWQLPEDFSLPPGQVHFYAGSADTVFRPRQVRRFAQRVGGAPITFYPGLGHLLYVAEPRVFDDILAFFEAS